MLGQSAIVDASSTDLESRMFVYEVTGLRQTPQNDRNDYPFRTSGNVFIKVPYSRMNEEMRRITRMGGKIVGIRSLKVDES